MYRRLDNVLLPHNNTKIMRRVDVVLRLLTMSPVQIEESVLFRVVFIFVVQLRYWLEAKKSQ